MTDAKSVTPIDSVTPANVPNTLQITAAMDFGGTRPCGIVVPSEFDGSAIGFQVSHDGTTWQTLYDDANVVVSFTVAASRSYSFNSNLALFAPWRWWKLTTGSAQNGTDGTTFQIMSRPL